MAITYEISAMVRQDVGKGASRRLRRQTHQVPGILYGAKKAPTPITVDHNKLMQALENEAFYSHILTVDLEGDKQKVVLKDLQRHPFEPRILHIDFLRISETEKIIMQVPVHFLNAEKSPGVKSGGIVSHTITSVEISCLPAHLPEKIDVDLSTLPLNGVVHLSDLVLPQGVELIALAHGHDEPVASIHMPRAAEVDETIVVPNPEVEAIKQSAPEAKTEGAGKDKSKS